MTKKRLHSKSLILATRENSTISRVNKLMNEVFSEGFVANNRRLVIFYSKLEDKVLPSHEIEFQDVCNVNDWLKTHGELSTEISEGVHRLDFQNAIYLFEVYEDDGGVVLSGFELKKNRNVRWVLLKTQADYLTRDSVA